MRSKANKAPEIEYPRGFLIPGPATQADSMLECLEFFLNDHLTTYTFFDPDNHMTPEEWVDFRSLYSTIHWMYLQLGAGEGALLKI